ncbi:helix-turn-helix domain-containing protein [Liquorilactobacillus capillatus]|uniref:Insertion element IS150 protein InsJ-like helix-turn-helix domain-containing protein n=1 Tax=Liquorilactobacillus capillatus DSM 19910 TaxID=1423731 RepID=A0A0R1M360_9LACO|nr:helix-turn-helix domain-containing protein [Liquorilactobacillus capillatus]KRL02464.1 hypothetical protein FC81_GL000808 [Liquorilactobacillus capillatus DSM 19910]
MRSYIYNFKLKVVKEYLNSESSLHTLCLKYKIPSDTPLVIWLSRYKAFGPTGLKRHKRRRYSNDFKVTVITYYLNHATSIQKTAVHFDISHTVVYNWLKLIRQFGIKAVISSKIGRPKMVKKKKATSKKNAEQQLIERQQKRIKQLEQELSYTKVENVYLKKLDAVIRSQKQD